jgi:hypothetical protein
MNNFVNMLMVSHVLIPDSTIDQIEIIWDPSLPYPGTKVKNCPEELKVIEDYFSRSMWSTLLFIAKGVRDKESVGIDESGFLYAHNGFENGEQPFEGVKLYGYYGEVFLSESAFQRLMSRFFLTIVKEAPVYKDQIIEQPWWPEFVKIGLDIVKQVNIM